MKQISLPSAAYFMWAVRGNEWINGWPKNHRMRHLFVPVATHSNGFRPHLPDPQCWCIPTEVEDGVWSHYNHLLSVDDQCRMAVFTRLG